VKVQLRFLDPLLNQFVEGSDVGEIYNFSLSLAMLNRYLVMRRVFFVVGAIFKQGRCWSRPPQIQDEPITLCLPDSSFVYWLCLSALEDDDLSLELAIELPQHLLIANGILTIKIRYLPIAIDRACCSFICFFISASI